MHCVPDQGQTKSVFSLVLGLVSHLKYNGASIGCANLHLGFPPITKMRASGSGTAVFNGNNFDPLYSQALGTDTGGNVVALHTLVYPCGLQVYVRV